MTGPIRRYTRACAVLLLALNSAPPGARAADDSAPRAAAVTVLTAARSCFAATVEVSGILLPRDEVAIRPDRVGAKVAEIMVDAGDNVTAGQILARLTTADGGSLQVQATAAGLVSASTAVVGTVASAKGEALFTIIPRSEFDFIGQVPVRDLARLKVDQSVVIKVIGAGDLDGRVRRIASSVEPNSQLGQVIVQISGTRRLMSNAYARATIKTGESCGIAVPLTAILYGSGGTVVQVIRRQRIETRRVELGLMAGGRIEVREGLAEGDVVVARAGALLREGDAVKPVAADVK